MNSLRYVILTIVAAYALPSQAAPVCFLGMIPCFVDCHLPRERPTDAIGAARLLRQQPYDKLTGFDQWTALLTTPFKCLGLNSAAKVCKSPRSGGSHQAGTLVRSGAP